jgi:hypothetical protein
VKGAKGAAILADQFIDQGWRDLASEVNIRTKSGLEGRVDRVVYHPSDGTTVSIGTYLVCEAKCGPSAVLSANQSKYLQEVARGEFEFTGPKGIELQKQIDRLELKHGGAFVGASGGSQAGSKGVGAAINEAFRNSPVGARFNWFSGSD